MAITKIEFTRILKNAGLYDYYSDLTTSVQNEIFNFFESRGYDYKEVQSIISGATKKEILTSQVKKKIKIDLVKLVKDMCKKEDVELYRKIDNIFLKFKQTYREKRILTPGIDGVIKDCRDRIHKLTATTNTSASEFAFGELEKLYKIACIYQVISKYTIDEKITSSSGMQLRVADYIVGKRLMGLVDNSIESSIENLKDLETFLENVTDGDAEKDSEVFTQADVAKLLKSCVTFTQFANLEKYNKVKEMFYAYFEKLANAPETTEEEADVISNITAKSILLQCSTIITRPTANIQFAMNFMLGEKAGDQLGEKYMPKRDEKDLKVLNEYFPNLRIDDMDMNHHIYALNRNVGVFNAITPASLHKSTMILLSCVADAYGLKVDDDVHVTINELKKKGFDIEKIYSKDNIFDIFSSQAEGGVDVNRAKIRNNIQTLSKYISLSDMLTVLRHNINFFMQEPEEVLSILQTKESELGLTPAFEDFLNQYLNKTVREVVLKPTSNPNESINISRTRRKRRVVFEDNEIEEDLKEAVDVNLEHENFEVDLLGLIKEKPVAEKKQTKKSPQETYEFIKRELETINIYLDSDIDLDENQLGVADGIIVPFLTKKKRDSGSTFAVIFKKKFAQLIKQMNNYAESEDAKEFQIEEFKKLITDIKSKIKLRIEKQKEVVSGQAQKVDSFYLREHDKPSRAKLTAEIQDLPQKEEDIKQLSEIASRRKGYGLEETKKRLEDERDESIIEKEIFNEERKSTREKETPKLISYNQELRSLEAIRDILSELDEKSIGVTEISGEAISEEEAKKLVDKATRKLEKLKSEFKLKYGNLTSAQVRKNSFAMEIRRKIREQEEIIEKTLKYISIEPIGLGDFNLD